MNRPKGVGVNEVHPAMARIFAYRVKLAARPYADYGDEDQLASKVADLLAIALQEIPPSERAGNLQRESED